MSNNKDKGLLYFKQDSHWTSLGAFYGTEALLEKMGKAISPYSFNKTETDWHELHRLHPVGKISEQKYPDIDFNLNDVCTSSQDNNGNFSIESKNSDILCVNQNKSENLAIFRDSFAIKMIPYLQPHFKNIRLFWRYDISETDIMALKDYDTVILENVERRIPHILNKTFPKE